MSNVHLNLIGEIQGLSEEESIRYRRHLALPTLGSNGQRRLKSARVLVIGAGGLGSPVLLYLAAAGVGTIGIVDHDNISLSNLQRQVLHISDDVGSPKVDSAAASMRAINPLVQIQRFAEPFTSENSASLIRDFDVVVDATDSIAAKRAANAACVQAGKPLVWASIYRHYGQVAVSWHVHGGCYECLYPAENPEELAADCSTAGVMGTLCGVIGSVQAGEVIKLIVGAGDPLIGAVYIHDELTRRSQVLSFPKNPKCTAGKVSQLQPRQHSMGPVGAIKILSTTDLVRLLEQRDAGLGAQLVLWDVRSSEEWHAGYIPGARHVPLEAVSLALQEIEPGQRIIFYCQSGKRSLQAATQAALRGLNVENLSGGYEEYSNIQITEKMTNAQHRV